MNNFKIGQKVVSVEKPVTNARNGQPRGIAPKVKSNTIHEVKAICYCSQCGRQKVDIGLIIPQITLQIGTGKIICSCGFNYPHNGRWFLDSVNFRPLQYDNISAEIVEKLKLTEEKSDIKPEVKPEIKIEQHEQA